jgi:hypothetical protein
LAAHDVAPAVALKVPSAQGEHTVSLVLVAAVLAYLPAGHSAAVVQLVALLPVLNWPVVQSVQTRSTVAEGVFDTKVPAGQVPQGAHEAAPEVALNVPVAQVPHTVSLTLVA